MLISAACGNCSNLGPAEECHRLSFLDNMRHMEVGGRKTSTLTDARPMPRHCWGMDNAGCTSQPALSCCLLGNSVKIS